MRQAHNAAFRSRRGAHDVESADWEMSLARPDSRADWSWIARATADPGAGVIGYALNSMIRDPESGQSQGWTERFGVRPEFRSAGLGRALLAASMHSFEENGCTMAGIGVDTDDPRAAESLFGALGYQFDDRLVLYGRLFED